MPTVPRNLARYTREQVENYIEIAVWLLDTVNGDCDLEEDDPSGQSDEDEFNTASEMAWTDIPECQFLTLVGSLTRTS